MKGMIGMGKEYDTRDIAKALGITHGSLLGKIKRMRQKNGDFSRALRFGLYFDRGRNLPCWNISEVGMEILAHTFNTHERKRRLLAMMESEGKEV